MNVSLNEHFERYIQSKVSSGQYHSVSEVIREALRIMQERDQDRQARLDFYRGEVQKGMNSGASLEWNLEKTLAKAHARADSSKLDL